MAGERGEPGGWTSAGLRPVSLEARGQGPLSLVLARDVRLTLAGVSIVVKPFYLHPLPVVGGGVPITRH